MLFNRCSVCLSCLSVTLLYAMYGGQTVGCINMKLGMEVGLGPGHTVLDGDPAPPERGSAPFLNFWPMSVVAKRSPISATAKHLYKRSQNE